MTTDAVGEVWNFSLELCEGLSTRGIEVILAVLGGPLTGAQVSAASQIQGLRLLPSNYKLEWMPDPWRDVKSAGEWLLDLEAEFTPDVVHLNSYGHVALAWDAPVILTTHSCVASWWKAVKSGPLPADWGRYVTTVKAALKAADRITAPSLAMLRTLEENYGLAIDAVSACVIHNGRLASRFRRSQKEEFVFCAGRVCDAAKGTDTLAAAARNLPWPTYLAGDRGDASGRRWTSTGCRLLGKLEAEDLARFYARASIYAFPARYEPFGLSVLEAALSGCALVLGDIPSLREVWQDNAVFVTPGDAAALAAAIRRLIASPALREDLSEKAYRRACQLDRDTMTTAYLDLYSRAGRERFTCVA